MLEPRTPEDPSEMLAREAHLVLLVLKDLKGPPVQWAHQEWTVKQDHAVLQVCQVIQVAMGNQDGTVTQDLLANPENLVQLVQWVQWV